MTQKSIVQMMRNGAVYPLSVLAVASFLALVFFQKKPNLITLTWEFSGTSCEAGELFTDVWSTPVSHPQFRYNLMYPLTTDGFRFDQTVQAPISFFRFDPCLSIGSVTLNSLTITQGERSKTLLPPELQKWECLNCTKTLENDYLKITTSTNDGQFFTRDFNTYLTELGVTYHQDRPRIRQLLYFILAVVVPTQLIVYLHMSKMLSWPLLVSALVTGVTVIYSWMNTSWWLGFFKGPIVEPQTGLGHIHLNGYPLSFDVFLFFVPLFAGSLVLLATDLLQRYFGGKKS